MIQKAFQRLLTGLGGGALYLYYKGMFVSSMDYRKQGTYIRTQGKGMYGSDTLKSIFIAFGMEQIKIELEQKTVEQMANDWERRGLYFMMQEKGRGGYMLFWEENANAV